MPPMPSVAARRAQESSEYEEDDDDDGNSSSECTPTAEKSPTKTTGLEDESNSELDIEMGQTTESPYCTDYCFSQFGGEYDMAVEETKEEISGDTCRNTCRLDPTPPA